MIKLTKLTDYAVVILAEMAARKGVLLQASGLAVKTALPEPTVSKVLKLLAKGGVVTSVRGAGGGYMLDKMPEEISVAAVVTALDGPVALTACVEGSDECCAREEDCPIKGQWNPVNMAMREALEGVSLAQMMRHAA
ncbi:MAG: SUF system Fe-S cluster assembly regulator [Rhodospirillales bacterium]|nr:SUF system Fe-S cluster assembly regulator [Alphaproteobacteria bacterium]USO04638.1 MAG: SUF system Fe-S cluster assembly regulator [Rhodospirillales bacterium]